MSAQEPDDELDDEERKALKAKGRLTNVDCPTSGPGWIYF